MSDDEEDRKRTDHVCVNVGGNSQLITLGGVRIHAGVPKDPYPRGIAIFNANTLSWASSYDADAEAYTTNQDIRVWYDEG